MNTREDRMMVEKTPDEFNPMCQLCTQNKAKSAVIYDIPIYPHRYGHGLRICLDCIKILKEKIDKELKEQGRI